MSQSTSTTTDEFQDKIIIYKLFNDPKLLESLKTIGTHDVFSSLKEFCSDQLKVSIFLDYS